MVWNPSCVSIADFNFYYHLTPYISIDQQPVNRYACLEIWTVFSITTKDALRGSRNGLWRGSFTYLLKSNKRSGWVEMDDTL